MPEPKTCACGCSQTFITRGRYKRGHRPPETLNQRALICGCGCNAPLQQEGRQARYYAAKFLPGHSQKLNRLATRHYTPIPEEIPSGFCECGCGEKTPIVTDQTLTKIRWFIGLPRPFMPGHGRRRFPTGKGVSKRHPILKRALPELTPEQRGYFAGIIDGEGSIVWGTQRGVTKKRYVYLECGNTSHTLIQWLGSFAGKTRTQSTTSAGNPFYHWRLAGRADVYALLIQIEPHMIIKRAKAQEAIAHLQDQLDQDYHLD